MVQPPHFSQAHGPTGDPLSVPQASIGALTASTTAGFQLRLVLAFPRRLDHLALSTLLRRLSGVSLVAAEVSLAVAVEACKATSPDAAIFDVSYPERSALTAAESLIESGFLKSVAFLDDRFALFRAQRALKIRGACYFTRSDDIQGVCDRLRHRREASSMLGVAAVEAAGPFFLTDMSALKRYDTHGLLALSPKERAVMEWLGRGLTIKEAAERLNLAMSTVDNHKSRIMKKLNVNRASQLIRMAMETGLSD